jgi:type II secretory ATPase GspE/PulE/Tfp pilus assembly ATPase PilB-like protein
MTSKRHYKTADMGVENFLLSSPSGESWRKGLSVSLPACKEELPHRQVQELKAWGFEGNTIPTGAPGCEKCFYTGFMGRMGIFEFSQSTKTYET